MHPHWLACCAVRKVDRGDLSAGCALEETGSMLTCTRAAAEKSCGGLICRGFSESELGEEPSVLA